MVGTKDITSWLILNSKETKDTNSEGMIKDIKRNLYK